MNARQRRLYALRQLVPRDAARSETETETELDLEGQRTLASHVDALVRMWRLGRDL